MLIVARHGQTDLNAAGALQGRLDPPLNAVGRRHAVAIGRALAGAAMVISSPLQRAQHTAMAITDEVTIDDRWLELDFGTFDGMALSDVPPDVWRRWRNDPTFRFGGGESLAEVFARVRAACTGLIAQAVDHDVVVVSHVSAIKAAVTWAMGGDERSLLRMRLDQASICRISISPDGVPTLLSFNETHHLGESGSR